VTVEDFAEFCSELVLENGQQMELTNRTSGGPAEAGPPMLLFR